MVDPICRCCDSLQSFSGRDFFCTEREKKVIRVKELEVCLLQNLNVPFGVSGAELQVKSDAFKSLGSLVSGGC